MSDDPNEFLRRFANPMVHQLVTHWFAKGSPEDYSASADMLMEGKVITLTLSVTEENPK